MSEAVLDASAVLAFLNREPGRDVVGDALPSSEISAANLVEVVTRLLDMGFSQHEVRDHIDDLKLDVVPLDEQLALDAGYMREPTRSRGLSLGDRACLALARARNVPALTTDRAWRDVDVGVEIRVIRD